MPAAQQQQQVRRVLKSSPMAWTSKIAVWLGILQVLCLLAQPATAVFVQFENCLDPNIINSNPKQLQLTPMYVDVRFNTSQPSHNLNTTIYGNVSGQAVTGTYPSADDPSWKNANDTCKQKQLTRH